MMLKRPFHWFFTRLGLGMALASGGAPPPSPAAISLTNICRMNSFTDT